MMQKLFMIQAFLQRYVELYYVQSEGKIGEEWIFQFDDDALSVRFVDEGYEYSWMSTQGVWRELASVSELKEMLE